MPVVQKIEDLGEHTATTMNLATVQVSEYCTMKGLYLLGNELIRYLTI